MNRYGFSVAWSGPDNAYLALCAEFPGLSAFGQTPEQAISELETALELAIETYEEEGWELPQPREQQSHSGQLRVRLPRVLHARLSAQAELDGVSLNTLIVAYLAEALGPRAGNVGDRAAPPNGSRSAASA